MKEIAVMGDLGSVIAYRGLGFHVVSTTTDMDLQAELSALIDQNRFAVIYLTDAVAMACEPILNEMRDQYLPALIPIPSAQSTTDYGLVNVEEAIRKAVGFDVLSVMQAHQEEDLDPEQA